MTRSVEIPEEGGLRGLYDDTRVLVVRGSQFCEIALKLGDEERFFVKAADLLAATHEAAVEANAAPAGDGGLREALEKVKQAKRRLWAGLMAVKPKLDEPYPDDARWTPWTRFVGPRLDDLWAAVDALLLSAHPAVPAVPQPVDREALIDALRRTASHHEDHDGAVWVDGWAQDFAEAVLAVLAGEQEQVEP